MSFPGNILRALPGGSALIARAKKALGTRGYVQLANITYKNISLGLVTTKRCDFQDNPKFKEALAAGAKQYNFDNDMFEGYYLHTCLWAGKVASCLKGDFVECGVWNGGTSMALVKYLDFEKLTDRRFYLFDTYCGLDAEDSDAEEYAHYDGDYGEYEALVRESFKDYPNVVIVKGAVPASLQDVNIERVAYLHIDMNCALPEKEALSFFWPKMAPGGIIIFDDYAWPGHEKQMALHDEFARSQGSEVLTLPTGQGLMVKT